MQNRTLVGNVSSWARDFAILGAAAGTLAPLTVIFDPVFALAAGLVGAVSGVVFGGVAGALVDAVRKRVPLSVMIATAAVLGSLWGAGVGTFGGAVTAVAGSTMGGEAVVLGFICGATSGMVYVGGLFLPYLIGATWGRTAPVVLLGMVAAPFAGWAGIAALAASSFGLWLFALPPLFWAARALDDASRPPLLTATRQLETSL